MRSTSSADYQFRKLEVAGSAPASATGPEDLNLYKCRMAFYTESVTLDDIRSFSSRDLIPLICSRCGIEFLKPKNKIVFARKNGKRLYCTAACSSAYLKSLRVTVQCANCSQNVSVKPADYNKSISGNFFCGQSCAAQFNNKIRIRKILNGTSRSRKAGICQYCGGPTQQSRRYCSNLCHCKAVWDLKKAEIEAFGGFPSENRHLARKYLLEKYGNVCSICGVTEWCGEPVPLVCDHIDGHSDNNWLTNLRMVCHNCNALLPTFASRNRGNGRQSKREAYYRSKERLTSII